MHNETSNTRPKRAEIRAAARRVRLACALVVATVWVFLGTLSAFAQGRADDDAETLVCDGRKVERALCKPARVCNVAANSGPIQSAAGSDLPAPRSNTITFSSIPPTGATVSYEFRVPRLDTSKLTPSGLVQDSVLTPTLTTSGQSAGSLGVGDRKTVQKIVADGYSERLDIADRGSTLRVVGYSVSCVPKLPPRDGDLKLREDVSPATFRGPGDTLTFTYVASNDGLVPLSRLTLDSSKVEKLACAPVAIEGTLQPGTSTTCTGTRRITAEDTNNPCLTDEAFLQGVRPDGIRMNANASAKACLTNERTQAAIARFIDRRTDLLLSNGPDRARLMRRIRGGAPAGDGAVAITGSGDDANASVAAAASLESVRASVDNGAIRAGARSWDDAAASATRPLAFDVWMEAHYQRWSDGLDTASKHKGDFGVAYLGADYLVAPGLLVGALVQTDFMSDFSESFGSEASGVGWMAGPYLSMQLADAITFDARAAWGTSSNDVLPFGTYGDTFDTERWITSASLNGNWAWGALQITPTLGLAYARETQQAFVDTLGLPVPEQSSHLGRMSFTQEFSTDIGLGSGATVTPFVSGTVGWDFAKSAVRDEDGKAISRDDVRFRLEGGATLRGEGGTSIRASASYDGIGSSDYKSVGGQLWFNVPIEMFSDGALFASLGSKCCDGRSYAGAADVAPAGTAPADAPAAVATPPAPQAQGPAADEPAYELPSVVVETKKDTAPTPGAKPKKNKPQISAEAPQKPTKPKAKGSAQEEAPATQSEASAAQGTAGVSGAGGEGGTTGTALGLGADDADLSGRAGQRTVEKIGTVEVVSAKEIERSGARSLDEAINLLPGVQVRNAADGVPRIDIRGFRTRSIQLLLDGVPINSAYDGQFDPRPIPVENIARIKVTKGASSVLYGPGGNAAVIDIVTKSAAKGLHGSAQAEWSPEKGTQERVTSSYGSDKLKVFMSASGLDQDEFTLSRDFTPTSLQPDRTRENSDRRDRALYANTVWSPSEVAKFGLSINYRTGDYGKPPATLTRVESDYVPRTRFERVEDYENLSVQSSSWIRFTPEFSIRPMAYYNRSNEFTDAFDDATYTTQTKGQTFSQDATTQIGGAGLQALFGGNGNQFTIALDGHNESYSAKGFTVPCTVNADGICLLDGVREDLDLHRDVQVFSAAAEHEMKLMPSVSAVLGAGYAGQRRSGDMADAYTYLAGVRVDVTDTTALRGSHARKIRFPTLRDLYDVDGGNPDLKTEISHTYEVGLEQTLPALKSAFGVALFHIDAQDFIQRQNGIFSNVSQLQFQGIETTARYRDNGFDLTLGYTFLQARNNSPNATTDKVQNEPAHKVTAQAAYAFDNGLAVSAEYLFVAGAYAIAGGGDGGDNGVVAPLALGSYHVVNVGATQDVPGTTAQLFGRIENLFDENYVENFGFPQAGRTFFAGMRAKF